MSDSGTALIVRAVRDLTAAGVPDPQRDARRLFAHAAGIQPDRVTLVAPEPVAPEAAARFADAVARRAARQPVSQIVGWRDFYGRRFRVTPDTLDPRPETEAVVAHARAEAFRRVLDLGTGTGCLLLSLLAERPEAEGAGVDVSAAACDVARGNARDLGLAGRARILHGDWYGPVHGRFDLIVSNPPYIARHEMTALAPEVRDWEPATALTDGGDGLAAYRAILAGMHAHLEPAGRLIVEIGAGQGPEVAALFRAAGLDGVAVGVDLDGRDRVVSGRWRPGA
ncbi:MAG: peptide chain release factor N(5)-glutamine methyltransferase [Tranquillimonas sp.]